LSAHRWAVVFGGLGRRNLRHHPSEFLIVSLSRSFLEALEFNNPILKGRGKQLLDTSILLGSNFCRAPVQLLRNVDG